MNSEEMEIHVDDTVERVKLQYVPQESVPLYKAVDADGEVVALLLAEAVDNPKQFEQRSEAEQDAMQLLALDEYYEGQNWEGTIIDE